QLQEQYVRHLSGFVNWDQLAHAQDWILFKQNLGPFLSIDETSLSQGELYTVVTNKQGKGRKGTLVAMVKGVESEKVIQILKKLPQSLRQKVKEITLDLAGSMERIARHCFPKARRVSDRFHVQQLAGEAVQELRIDYRWQAIEQENKEMELAKELGREHVPKVLANGDTLKQHLAIRILKHDRSRLHVLVFKKNVQITVFGNVHAGLQRSIAVRRSSAGKQMSCKGQDCEGDGFQVSYHGSVCFNFFSYSISFRLFFL